jgi:ribosomal protein L29
MTKGTSAKEYRKRSNEDIVSELKKLREELQTIRFTKVSGTAVAKLSKIKVRRFILIFRSSENRSPDFSLLSEKTERTRSLVV